MSNNALEYIKRMKQVSKLLQEKKSLREIAKTFNTTTRTIQNDIHELRKLGAKIHYNSKDRCYQYEEEFIFYKELSKFLDENGTN